MEDRRHLPPDGGGNAKRSASAECDTEDRAVRKEQGDPETSTQMCVRKDDLCDVPRKVPRFQYVDFPSLHQCIQQLSVPPLNGWLGSCSLAKAPNYRPASPKEKVPKFKYVDYPSLHHCIQQLSVPPLESWSAGLLRFNAEGKQDGSGSQKRPSQPGTVKNNISNEAGDQNNEDSSRVISFSFPRDTHNTVSGKEERPQHYYTSEVPQRLEKDNAPLRSRATKPDAALQSDCRSRAESGSGSRSAAAVVRNDRPSVINMVHTDKQKHWTMADHLEEQLNSPDSVGRVPWKTIPESVCPFCQQMFTNPEQFRAHQRSHRDKYRNAICKKTCLTGNLQVYDLIDDLNKEENILETQSIINNQSMNTFGTQEDENKLDPTNTCPVCFSVLKPACIKGTTELLQCTRCLTTQLLCGSCLYPCISAACTNKPCPLLSTLLTCDLVSDPQSKVFGCPMFRACPKCHNLIMHEKGCKSCTSCFHWFCFICLEGDCSKDKANYWKLTCTKPRADRQRFMAPQS